MASSGFDLAVVGGGVIGLAHAYVAARAGKRVVLIERDRRANGASIRNFGFITVTGQARRDMWPLARRAREVWAGLAPAAGIAVEQRGLYLMARSAEAVAVVEAFLATEMGEGCRLLAAEDFRRLSGGLGGPDLAGVLFSPHELRVESRTAIPALAAWLVETLGVTVLPETVVFDAAPPRLVTSRGVIEAAACVVCPGDDFATLYAERLAGFGLSRCRLSMLRLADPGFRPPGTLMSDLGLVRYRGYADLSPASALEARLHAEHPECFDHGVHLIVAQGGEGTLVVGDSHHYDALPPPFAPAAAEDAILAEYTRALGRAPPAVLERWTGEYAVAAGGQPFLIDAPEPNVRIVIVTSGAGASIAFGLAERALGDLLGLQKEFAA